MESEKQTLTIANPFFDVTFKDLFGPQGSVVNGISSEERLLSLINEIIDDQQFTNIEFFDNPRNIFIITCKCWSDHSPYIYCIGFQKHLLPQNKDQFIVDGTHLVKDVADTVSYFTHFRIISILNYVLDDTQPGIFPCKICDSTGDILSDFLQWKFIQLPILFEQGTNMQWLKLLSLGTMNQNYIDVQSNDFDNSICQNALELLSSYTEGEKSEKIEIESKIISDIQDKERSKINPLDNENQSSAINQELTNNILDLKIKHQYSNDDISNLLGVALEFVNLVVSIAELSQSFLDYCRDNDLEPDFDVFLEEARKKYDIPDEYIKSIEQARYEPVSDN